MGSRTGCLGLGFWWLSWQFFQVISCNPLPLMPKMAPSISALLLGGGRSVFFLGG